MVREQFRNLGRDRVDVKFRTAGLFAVMLLAGACGAYGPKSVPTQNPTAQAQTAEPPAATIGPLTLLDVADLGLTMLVPSTWKPPVAQKDSLILSPDGSTDTSVTAGPFLFVIPYAEKVVPGRLNYTFQPGINDPAQQLDMLVQAFNIDAPAYNPTESYIGAQYPAAIKRGFQRGNEFTFVLMNAGNGHWLYIGTQARERDYKSLENTVFRPVINSIKLKDR